MYPDLKTHDRILVVIEHLFQKMLRLDDPTELASYNELATLERLFVNPKTGKPTTDAINIIRKLVTLIKKDKAHPHIRPYAIPKVEITVDGKEVVRNYVTLLMGPQLVAEINARLEKQKTGLTESQKANKELVNMRKVMKELEQYIEELKAQQEDANRKKRKRK